VKDCGLDDRVHHKKLYDTVSRDPYLDAIRVPGRSPERFDSKSPGYLQLMTASPMAQRHFGRSL
jgi:hypothetical protein